MDKRFKRPLNPKYNHLDHVCCHGGCLGGSGCDHVYFANRNNMRVNHNHGAVDYNNSGSYASKVHFRNSMRGKSVFGPVGGNLRIQTRSDLKRQNNELNKMCILHLNLIQEQNEEMIEKDKEIEKRDTEIAMLRHKIQQLEVLDKEIEKRENEISRLCNINKTLEEKLSSQRQLHRKYKSTSFEVNSLPQAKISRHADPENDTPKDVLHLQHSQIQLPLTQTDYQKHNQTFNFIDQENQHQQGQVVATSSHNTLNNKANGEFNGKKVTAIFLSRINQESGNQDSNHLEQSTIPDITETTSSYDHKNISNNIEELSDQQEQEYHYIDTRHDGDGGDIYLDTFDSAVSEEVVNTQEESCSTGTTVIETLATKPQVEITEVVMFNCAENNVEYDPDESASTNHEDKKLPIMLMHATHESASYFPLVKTHNTVLTDTESIVIDTNSKNSQTPAAHSTPTLQELPQQQEDKGPAQTQALKMDQAELKTTEERPAVIEMDTFEEIEEEKSVYQDEKQIELKIELPANGSANLNAGLSNEKAQIKRPESNDQSNTAQEVQKMEVQNHNSSSPIKIKEIIPLVSDSDGGKKKQIVKPIKKDWRKVSVRVKELIFPPQTPTSSPNSELIKLSQNVSGKRLRKVNNDEIYLPCIRPDENSPCLSTKLMYAARGWEDTEFHHDLEFYLDEAAELNKDNPKLEIPKWEVVNIPPSKGSKNLVEDVSDEAYENRHKKLVDEEIKRKRRDANYLRDEYLRLKQLERELPEETKKDLPLTTLYPLPDDVEEVCFVSHLPVQAFGECIVRPFSQRVYFRPPWLETENTEGAANPLKTSTTSVATLGCKTVSTTAAQKQQQQLTSSYVVIKKPKRQRNHVNNARQRATKKTANNQFASYATTGGNRERAHFS